MATDGKGSHQPWADNPVWVKRWINLIQWWEARTGRSHGRCPYELGPDYSYPPSIGDSDATEEPWPGQDPELFKLISDNAYPFFLCGEGINQGLWKWQMLGQDKINRYATWHDEMVFCLRRLLDMEGIGSWVEEVGNTGRTGSRHKEYVAAAKLLVTSPNPYPRVKDGNPTIKVRSMTERKDAARLLHELRTAKGNRQTEEELAVLFMLVCPLALGKVGEVVRWWEGRNGWEYPGGDNDVDAEGLVNESIAFGKLKRRIRDYHERD